MLLGEDIFFIATACWSSLAGLFLGHNILTDFTPLIHLAD